MDESGCPVPDWIGCIRAARNSQEQNLEAVSDLPGGQVSIVLYLKTHKAQVNKKTQAETVSCMHLTLLFYVRFSIVC